MLIDWLSDVASDVRYRARAIFRRRDMERELADELRFHLEREAEKHARAGLDPGEAMRRARLAFGGVERFKDETRDTRGISALEVVARDLRHAARRLRVEPGFAVAAVVTLALGIGANAAMFGVVDHLLFRAPPLLRDPATVHRAYLARLDAGKETVESSTEYARYLDLRRWTTSSLAQTAAFATRALAVGRGEDAREMPVATVSASFFDFFDAAPAVGRYFTSGEDTVPAGAPVVVLSHAFWTTHFAGRRDVLGETLLVGSVPCTIIGVAAEGFTGVPDDGPPAAFIPLTTFAASFTAFANPSDYYATYGWSWLQVMVRRRPGTSAAEAEADLSRAYRLSWDAARAASPALATAALAKPRVIVAPLSYERGPNASGTARVARWVGGVSAIVLLIACANVANLLLARALRRRREIAVRLALGAGRGRLLAQSLTESLLLAALGGVTGVLVAHWGTGLLRTLFLPAGTALDVLGDPRTLLVAGATALGAGLLTGLAPALHGRRGDLAEMLKAGAREGSYQRSRVRTILLVLQGALSLVLLVGAGLFVRSLLEVRSLRLGYDVDPVLYVHRHLRGAVLTRAEREALGRRLEDAARSIPAVAAASRAGSVPLLETWGQTFFVPGIDSVRRLGRFTFQAGSADFFRAMGTRILRGRAFADSDRRGAPLVAVVSEGSARALWPGREPIGQCMKMRADTMPCTTVVGVAENIKQTGLGDDQQLQIYLAIEQAGTPTAGLFVRVRDGDASRHAEVLRRRLHREMPGASYVTVTPMRAIVDARLRSWRLGATMFLAFGALAVLVAAVGLYGVIAYTVAQRTRDLGVRMAMGARGGDLARLVLGEGLRFAALGIGLGLAIALAAGRWVAPLLFETSPRDPLVLGAAAAVLLVVAAAASLVPARRAARVDPLVALRAE